MKAGAPYRAKGLWIRPPRRCRSRHPLCGCVEPRRLRFAALTLPCPLQADNGTEFGSRLANSVSASSSTTSTCSTWGLAAARRTERSSALGRRADRTRRSRRVGGDLPDSGPLRTGLVRLTAAWSSRSVALSTALSAAWPPRSLFTASGRVVEREIPHAGQPTNGEPDKRGCRVIEDTSEALRPPVLEQPPMPIPLSCHYGLAPRNRTLPQCFRRASLRPADRASGTRDDSRAKGSTWTGCSQVARTLAAAPDDLDTTAPRGTVGPAAGVGHRPNNAPAWCSEVPALDGHTRRTQTVRPSLPSAR